MKFRHYSNNSLVNIREWVSDRIGKLIDIRPDDNTIYQYNVLKKLYMFAKTRYLGYSTKIGKKCINSHQVVKIQLYVKYYTALYALNSSEINLAKLQLAHKQLQEVWQIERQKSFVKWLSKLDKLTYQRATRSFFSELRSRNHKSDEFGPIENSKGVISKSLPECLKNWVDFFRTLYTEVPQNSSPVLNPLEYLKPTPENLSSLNKDITINELVLAINTLKDFSSPGEDKILNRDLTVLLVPVQDNVYRWDIVKFIHKILIKFWSDEAVPPSFKESIIRPFLKPEKTPSKRENYRPISLLNALMKVYEQVIKYRLVKFLEDSKFFSNTQAAYRKGRSTVDNHLFYKNCFFTIVI